MNISKLVIRHRVVFTNYVSRDDDLNVITTRDTVFVVACTGAADRKGEDDPKNIKRLQAGAGKILGSNVLG